MQITGQIIVATLALVLSVVVALSQFRDRRHMKFTIEKAHIDGLMAWHGDVIVALCDLRDDSIEAELRGEKRRLLSALIEQGASSFQTSIVVTVMGRRSHLHTVAIGT